MLYFLLISISASISPTLISLAKYSNICCSSFVRFCVSVFIFVSCLFFVWLGFIFLLCSGVRFKWWFLVFCYR